MLRKKSVPMPTGYEEGSRAEVSEERGAVHERSMVELLAGMSTYSG